MALKFWGRGSGFSEEHTSAYFTTVDDVSEAQRIVADYPDIEVVTLY